MSKSSFYQGFGGKKELFIRCLGRYRIHMYEVFEQLLNQSGSGLKFIETVLLSSTHETGQAEQLRRGCLLMNTATEFAQKDQQVAEHVSIGFKGSAKGFEGRSAAGTAGWQHHIEPGCRDSGQLSGLQSGRDQNHGEGGGG